MDSLCIKGIQKGKRLDEYTLFLSDGSSYTIDETSLVTYCLRKDMVITAELSSVLAECQVLSSARKLANRFLQLKPRTIKEVNDYLKKHSIASRSRSLIIEELITKGYLDDAQYAKDWVEYKVRVNGLGSKRLFHELQQKGVESSCIEKALAQLSFHQEVACAKEHAEKRFMRMSNDSWDKVSRKISAYLMRKGYSVEVIYKAIANLKDRGE